MAYWLGSFNNNNNNTKPETRFSKFSSGSKDDTFIIQQLQIAYLLSDLSEEAIEQKYIIFLKKELDKIHISEQEDDEKVDLNSESNKIRHQVYVLIYKLHRIDPSIRKEIIDKWNNYYQQKANFESLYNNLENNNLENNNK